MPKQTFARLTAPDRRRPGIGVIPVC